MFEQATKERTYLRAALFGPSGSGKTKSALRIATGIASVVGGEIAFIDSERRSARKYSDEFKFKVCDIDDRSIAGYVKAMTAASQISASILIIDSLSHPWEELLGEVDRLANAKYSGNNFRAWAEGTPKQRQFIEALLSFPGHVIGTMRSDTDWVIDNNNGRMRPTKVGLKPRQGKGIEYEFDMLLEISTEHVATITKDRTGKFQDKTIEKPDEEFGKQLAQWLGTGAIKAVATDRPKVAQLNALIQQHNIPDTTIMEWLFKFEAHYLHEIKDEDLDRIVTAIDKKYSPQPSAA
jgi:ABC-type dipeptide/oligopeptide/nickel transport system ATPase component